MIPAEAPASRQISRAVPIYQTSSFVFKNCDHAAARFSLADAGNIYGRLTNPTQEIFEKRIAALEGGVAALAVASGAAAVYYSIANIASNGDHVVAAKNIYGGTYNLLEHTLPEYGIETTFVDIYKADVSKREEAASLIEFAVNKFDKIDVLINNAGIAKMQMFSDVTELHWGSIKFVIRNESEHTTSLIGMPELRFSDPTINWYRITEHKWFTPHRQNNDIFNKNTIISYEYGDKWERGKEPFYPIINTTSQNIYKRYYDKIKQTYSNFYLCGRKAEYKNYNMAETIESAMKLCDNWDYKNL